MRTQRTQRTQRTLCTILASVIALLCIIVCAPCHGRPTSSSSSSSPDAGLRGFDISLEQCDGPFASASVWSCFAEAGFSFVVIEAVQGSHGVAPNIISCVRLAQQAGLEVFLYGWFCPVCASQSSGSDTARDTIAALQGLGLHAGVNYSTPFWIDVENCDPYDNCWLASFDANRAYLESLVGSFTSRGALVGIYASPYEWQHLLGSSGFTDSAFSGLPLWYPAWGGKPNMSSFSSFGGWTTPAMHQYAASSDVCYSAVDLDFMPRP